MTAVTIRAATAADAPVIVALLRELAVYEKLERDFLLTEAAVRRDMLGAACRTELVLADGAGVGLASWFWNYKTFRGLRCLYLEDLYVTPSHRGRGLGKKLLAHLAATAREAGAIMEWRVLDWNTPSIDFYKSLGATLIPEWVDCRLEGDALERLGRA